uniref:ATXR3 C-terminal domain-containing protein n=1 Tax=Quercus lobata TaxID=97700 RepID=A0A7N2KUC6_QUELO
MKSWEGDLLGASKYKKKLSKYLTGRKYMTRSNGTSFANGGLDYGEGPEDYAEKLYAQKSGTEESDMELPEVKDYKTRRLLGDEDIEQEVYGIDPYTHNLLLDSMQKELDWPLLEKHLFIEDALLRTLNKQVRNFTGTESGNTPMMYSLQLVIEENEKLSEDRDIKAVKMCQGILKAIDSHPNDRYVAYRKIGIYSVCKIQYGEEITFDYNSVTEVLDEWHRILNCHQLMLKACKLNLVSKENYLDLGRAGLGSCLLVGLPDWVVAYSACLAEGVYNQRLQNLVVTLNKLITFFNFVMLRSVVQEYKAATSPPAYISPLGLGPGAKVWKPSRHRVYGPRNEIYAGKNGEAAPEAMAMIRGGKA